MRTTIDTRISQQRLLHARCVHLVHRLSNCSIYRTNLGERSIQNGHSPLPNSYFHISQYQEELSQSFCFIRITLSIVSCRLDLKLYCESKIQIKIFSKTSLSYARHLINNRLGFHLFRSLSLFSISRDAAFNSSNELNTSPAFVCRLIALDERGLLYVFSVAKHVSFFRPIATFIEAYLNQLQIPALAITLDSSLQLYFSNTGNPLPTFIFSSCVTANFVWCYLFVERFFLPTVTALIKHQYLMRFATKKCMKLNFWFWEHSRTTYLYACCCVHHSKEPDIGSPLMPAFATKINCSTTYFWIVFNQIYCHPLSFSSTIAVFKSWFAKRQWYIS